MPCYLAGKGACFSGCCSPEDPQGRGNLFMIRPSSAVGNLPPLQGPGGGVKPAPDTPPLLPLEGGATWWRQARTHQVFSWAVPPNSLPQTCRHLSPAAIYAAYEMPIHRANFATVMQLRTVGRLPVVGASGGGRYMYGGNILFTACTCQPRGEAAS